MLRVLVLSCSKGGRSEDKKRIQSTMSFGQNKRAKFSKEGTYNRFFLVADLESPPNYAAILPQSTDESSQLLAALTGGSFVGEPFFVYEPNKVGSTLGDHTPILSLKNSPLLPLRDPSSAICSTEASMAIPSKVGETNYFILTKKTIKFTKVRLAANLTCQGVMCDRQKDKNGCSCLHATGISAVVYEADVTFEVPERVNPKGKMTVPGFSSLKTTKVFFSNFATFATRHSRGDLQQNNTDTRRRWIWLTEYINSHGGWMLVGWFMLGDHSDAANPNDKVQNYQTTLHLSYVQPSQKDVTKDANLDRER